MNNENTLLKKLSALGLPLMETDETFDVHQTLAEVVKSHDTRLWEGFPVLLINATKDYSFDYTHVFQYLDSGEDKENYRNLLTLSAALYESYHLTYMWASNLKKSYSVDEKKQLKQVKTSLAHEHSFVLNEYEFSPARLKEMFNRYYEKTAEKDQKKKEKLSSLSLEYAMSQFFSPKQKELFRKKLEGRPLTKTEKEYYSRSVKKKVVALANSDLHHLAQTMMGHS